MSVVRLFRRDANAYRYNNKNLLPCEGGKEDSLICCPLFVAVGFHDFVFLLGDTVQVRLDAFTVMISTVGFSKNRVWRRATRDLCFMWCRLHTVLLESFAYFFFKVQNSPRHVYIGLKLATSFLRRKTRQVNRSLFRVTAPMLKFWGVLPFYLEEGWRIEPANTETWPARAQRATLFRR